jgi:hypothetical protein
MLRAKVSSWLTSKDMLLQLNATAASSVPAPRGVEKVASAHPSRLAALLCAPHTSRANLQPLVRALAWFHSNGAGEAKVPEKLNLIEALKDQEFQLRRILKRPNWMGDTRKASLEELEEQIRLVESVLFDIRKLIADQKAKTTH